MFASYFKMASRSLAAYKGTTTINILGLVTGIASALVIITVIRYELSFDAFHSNAARIYRVVRVSGSEMDEYRTGISYPVPAAMKEEISSLENITSMEYFGGAYVDVLGRSDTTVRKFREESGWALVEPSFFRIFDFKDTPFRWLAGDPEEALKDPLSVVLTRTMAKKYFGEVDAMGQTLRLQKKYDCKVTGVIEDLPPNTDFPFTILVSYASLHVMAGEDRLADWFSVNDSHNTYVVLAPGATKEDVEEQIAGVHAAHTPEELHEFRHYLLQAFRELHHDARFGNYNRRTISRKTVLALGFVALFLLLTASINYINLSTAQSALRAKEIGLRKVMGGNRHNLMVQFITETFVVVLTAGIIALGLGEVLLSNLQSLLNIKQAHYIFTDAFVLLALLAIVVLVTLFSGFYPSLIISRFSPVVALKNKFTTESIAGISLRKVLVVAQFTITQMLVVGTFIVVSQMRYFQHADMGFNQEAIITTRIPDPDPSKLKVLEDRLRAQAFVSGVSFSYSLPSGVSRNRSYQDIGGANATTMKDYTVFEYAAIDPSYLDLYQIKLLAGRNLAYSDSNKNILINKTLVKNLQLGSPDEAVGKELKIGGRKVTVAGVIGDYYSNSMKRDVDNIVMLVDPGNYYTMSVKLDAGNTQGSLPEAVKEIGNIWTATFPDFVFSYQFFDENVEAFYEQEQKYAQLFQLFSLIFLLIGCLGLYGLITFVVNRKGREVAVRKVLGATMPHIILLFSKEYVRLIILSFLLAVPVAWYAVNSWLQNFSNRIILTWWVFAMPGLLVLAIALLVIGTKSIRAAHANPVDMLKCE